MSGRINRVCVTSTHYFAFIAQLSGLRITWHRIPCHIDTLFCFHCTWRNLGSFSVSRVSHRHIILLSLHAFRKSFRGEVRRVTSTHYFAFIAPHNLLTIPSSYRVSHRHIILLSLHVFYYVEVSWEGCVTSTHYFAFIAPRQRLLRSSRFAMCHIDTLFCFHCTDWHFLTILQLVGVTSTHYFAFIARRVSEPVLNA